MVFPELSIQTPICAYTVSVIHDEPNRPYPPILVLTEHTEEPLVPEKTNRFVVLLRVSTKKQGGDGNGIAAQRRDIDLFLQQQSNHQVVEEFIEVESGAKSERPILEAAVCAAKKYKCPLVVSKVDRLTRDVEMLGRLTKMRGVQIRIASLPNADNFQIHLFGILGAQEREFISQRTRAAMSAAKERGAKFGNPRLAEINRTRKYEARRFADSHAALVKTLRTQGKTLREIAEILNDSGIKTRTGSTFHPVQVHRILKRLNG